MESDLPEWVSIREVGPREGIQTLGRPVSTDDKVKIIEALATTGLSEIEIGAFVSAKIMPQFSDTAEVAKRLTARPGVQYRAVYFTADGARRALDAGDLDVEGFVSVSPSDAFIKRVTNRTTDDVLRALPSYTRALADLGIELDAIGVMAAFGCNYAGDVTAASVVDLLERTMVVLADQGHTVREVTLADTMGWATPLRVQTLVGECRMRLPTTRFRLHLHDTRGLGLANACAGLALGVRHFDSSIAGVGGCPFTGGGGAAGNIVTEDFAHACEEMGVDTGIDLERLLEAARETTAILSAETRGKLSAAGTLSSRRGPPGRDSP